MAKKSAINNWTAEERYEFRREALDVLNQIKERRKGMTFILVKHPFLSKTWYEIKVA